MLQLRGMDRRNFLTTSVVLALPLTAPERALADSALPGEVTALLDRFGQSAGFSANFVEHKRILLLKEPITNRGRVYFRRPGTFARYIDEPFASRVLLRERRIRLEENGRSRVIELDAQPSVRALVGGFLALLEGDRVALVRDYRASFEARPNEGWRVRLEPHGAPVDPMLKELSFTGEGNEIRELGWVETSGDSSLTRFSEVRVNREFSQAEQQQLFSPSAEG
jgi:hypothetical protein